MEHQVHLVPVEQQAQKVQLVLQVQLEHQAQMVLQELLVLRVLLEQMEHLVQMQYLQLKVEMVEKGAQEEMLAIGNFLEILQSKLIFIGSVEKEAKGD